MKGSSKVLGLSFFYHDASAALIVDGKPVAMSEEERFSRIKHDSGYPQHAIKFVLDSAKINASELDYVVFYEKPFVKFERALKTSLATWPVAPLVFASAVKGAFIDKLWIRSLIARDLNISPDKVLFSDHHLSHGASAYYCSPFEESAILTVDGIGEWTTAMIGVGKGNNITIKKEIRFPHSLGLMYSAFTAFLGFEVNEGEYKVMGMAPYGTPRYADKVRKMITLFEDGSFALDMSYFTYHRSRSRSYSAKFAQLMGTPREPGAYFFTKDSGYPSYFGERPENWEQLADLNQHYADIAASVQVVTEEALVNLAKAAHRETNLPYLCYAGGVALNCVANWKILQQTPFERMYIQPSAGDAGSSLGAALHVHHALMDNPRDYVMDAAYYGSEYSDEEVQSFLDAEKIPYKKYEREEDLLEHVSEALANRKVAGWFQGRFEWGPRALGARSIIADPRSEEMKDVVNVKIKFREPYRPFAPSVLAERAEDYFEMPNSGDHYPARFMLYVTQVRAEKRAEVPAITHVDGSARPQLVYEETNSRYYRLIKKFEQKTGVPLIMNTSFNLKGEPIVTTPANAYATFTKSGLDLLVLGNYVVTKER